MTDKTVNIIQISDIHLNHHEDSDLLGVKTEESYLAVLEQIKRKNYEIDYFLLTGDLSQDGSPKSYEKVADYLTSFDRPVHCLPGNHDDAAIMDTVYPRGNMHTSRHLVLDRWQLILLDSHVHGKVHGYLDQDQLNYMEKCLRTHPDLFAVVAFHHQPVPVGAAWLDNLGVKNADEFWAIAEKYPQLNNVLFGHVHQEFDRQVGNIHVYSPPSTCIQFMRNQDEFGLEHLPPGYRVIKLHPDGKFETHVERVPAYVGYFDKDATGY